MRLLLCVFLFKFILCVPPSPTDRLHEDVSQIKKNLKNVSGQLEKLNTVYLTQIEPRMMTSNARLTNVDSNVKNLQERAHVWDTFQLHVSAWNDQMSSVDRKIDIISKGIENLLQMEAKFNAINSFEYKLENILKKVEENGEKLNGFEKKIFDEKTGQMSLFNEFTSRGILSSLKHLEKKIDKLRPSHRLRTKGLYLGPYRAKVSEYEPKSEIKLHLADISTKVDALYDDMNNNKRENRDEFLGSQEGSGEIGLINKNQCSSKELTDILEEIRNDIRNLSSTIKDHQTNTSCSEVSQQTAQNLSNSLNNILKSETDRESILISLFQEQQQNLKSTIRTNFETFCKPINNVSQQEVQQRENHRPRTYSEILPTTISNLSDCNEFNFGRSGLYWFQGIENVTINGRNFNLRFCEFRSDGMWTVIQRRDDYIHPENFSKNWLQYKEGFGILSLDFWFGNEFIHRMSQKTSLSLRIELEDWNGNTAYADYSDFWVTSEEDNYKLYVDHYSGNASDSLGSHNGSSFSTYDVKNDEAPPCCPCALSYGGGWWFNSCFESNLNGEYHRNPTGNDYFRGIIWEHWLGNYSLKKTLMMVKPKNQINKYQSTSEVPFYEDP